MPSERWAICAEIVPHGPRALEKALKALLASKLVLRSAASAPGALQFKHALVRDAAYDSLLRTRRESLHLKLAEALMARADGGRDVPPELIAHHLVKGGAGARSVPYWLEAARNVRTKGAELEASEFSRAGLHAAEEIEDSRERDTALCDLLISQQLSEYGRGDTDRLLRIVERAATCAERAGDPTRLSMALDAKTYMLASAGRVAEAIEAGRRCVAISRTLDNSDAFIGANSMLGRALYAAGRYREAVAQGEIVRDFLGEDVARGEQLSPINQTVSARVWLTFMLSELGAFEAAEREIAKAMELLPRVRAREHIGIWVTLGFGRLRFLRDDHRAVIDALEPKLALCRAEYPVYLPRLAMSFGPSLVATGEPSWGIAVLEEADATASSQNFRFGHALLLAQFSHALLQVGEAERAEETARRAMTIAREAGEDGNAAWAALRVGEALRALGRLQQARALIEAAAATAQEREMAPLLRRCTEALRSSV